MPCLINIIILFVIPFSDNIVNAFIVKTVVFQILETSYWRLNSRNEYLTASVNFSTHDYLPCNIILAFDPL